MTLGGERPSCWAVVAAWLSGRYSLLTKIESGHSMAQPAVIAALARTPGHWLMVAEIAGDVLVVPIAPSRSGDPRYCRPIGRYVAAEHLAARYREER